MPACAIDGDHGMCALSNVPADLSEVQVHGIGVDVGQHQGSADAACRTDGAEEVGPGIAAVARCCWSRAALGPEPGQGALLTNPCFILPPKLDRLAAGVLRDCGGDQVGEVFLCASWASAS